MSQPASATVDIKDFSKGMLTFAEETGLTPGFYDDAQNMLLTNRTPVTIGGLTKFNTTPCPSGNIIWCEPYTDSNNFTVLVVATTTGRLYKYTPSGDTWTELRRDFTPGQQVPWNSVPFRGTLLMANASGFDRIHKYDGVIVLPVGAKSITTFEDAASWTNGTAETSEIREGLTALKVTHGGASTISAERNIAQLDLSTGINGGPSFGNNDLICVQMFVSDPSKINNSTPTQQDTAADNSYSSIRQNTAATFYDWAFQFTAGSSFSLAKVQLDLQRVGSISPATVHVEIQTDAGGLPSNTPVTNGTSVNVNQAGLSDTQWVSQDFPFTTPPSLINGTVYHIVVKGDWTPDGSNYINIRNITGANNLAAVNTAAAATTWVENNQHTNWKLFSTNTAVALYLETTAGVNYFSGVVTTGLQTGWNRIELPRAVFTTTGAASWSNINKLRMVTVSTGAVTILWDDMYIRYGNAPPVATLIDMYTQQLCVAGIPTDGVLLKYSDAGVIDYFSPDQEARFSGGRHALEKRDQITALFAYFDELLVGKVNSAWTFSGTGLNVSISALPLTIGVDSHHGIAETPWSLQYLFENNIFGARLTSRGLVSTNISSLLANIDNEELNKVVTIRHDRTHTVRWSFRTTGANQLIAVPENDLGLIYDYVLDAWASRYTPHIRWMTRAIVNGNRELLAVQYDGFVRRMDVGDTFDGEPIESFVLCSWMQVPDEHRDSHVGRWYNITTYLKGTANVLIEARFADEPHEFDSAVFETYGTVQATPDGDKGFAYFGKTSRWMQLRLRATSGSFEIEPPIVIGLSATDRRV